MRTVFQDTRTNRLVRISPEFPLMECYGLGTLLYSICAAKGCSSVGLDGARERRGEERRRDGANEIDRRLERMADDDRIAGLRYREGMYRFQGLIDMLGKEAIPGRPSLMPASLALFLGDTALWGGG